MYTHFNTCALDAHKSEQTQNMGSVRTVHLDSADDRNFASCAPGTVSVFLKKYKIVCSYGLYMCVCVQWGEWCWKDREYEADIEVPLCDESGFYRRHSV